MTESLAASFFAAVRHNLVSAFWARQTHRHTAHCGLISDWFQVALIHDALVRLTAALDPILRFAAILWKLPEDRVVATGG
jgi:hypothetical protein